MLRTPAPFNRIRSKLCMIGLLMLVMLDARTEPPNCDPLLRPSNGGLGYLSRGNRCEGLYISPISGRTLEMVSLTFSRLRYPLEPDTNLKLRGLIVAQLDNFAIHIRAVALPLHTYYRMDAVLSPGNTLDWPVGSVLAPAKLGASRVGLFGWVDTPAGRVFVPIEITGAQEPDHGRKLKLIVRSSVDTSEVLWRLRTTKTSKSKAQWQTAVGRSLRAGHPIHIEIPKKYEGILRVEIAAQEQSGGEWSSLTIMLVNPKSS